jgi:hypothetical protein
MRPPATTSEDAATLDGGVRPASPATRMLDTRLGSVIATT